MAEFKIKKTDSRYNGHRHFKYIIDYGGKYGDSLTFQIHRNWWFEGFGSSCEIEAWQRHYERNAVALALNDTIIAKTWAWNTEFGNRKIYVKDDDTLSFFVLKFSA